MDQEWLKEQLKAQGYEPCPCGRDWNVHVSEACCKKQTQAAKYIEEKEWSGYLLLCEKRFAWDSLYHLHEDHGMPLEDAARLFPDAWVMCEHDGGVWREIVEYQVTKAGLERLIFSEADWEAFQALPDELDLFRGCYLWNKKGRSWTLDLSVARFFADRPAGRWIKGKFELEK